MNKKAASELEWLEWFYLNCDFGPAHEDVVSILKDEFEKETGKKIPKGWRD